MKFQTLQEAIRFILKDKGVTIAELSQMVNIPIPTLHQYENGTKPSMRAARQNEFFAKLGYDCLILLEKK